MIAKPADGRWAASLLLWLVQQRLHLPSYRRAGLMKGQKQGSERLVIAVKVRHRDGERPSQLHRDLIVRLMHAQFVAIDSGRSDRWINARGDPEFLLRKPSSQASLFEASWPNITRN
jgi:hypothetical protein